MIEITFYEKNNKICGFEIKGHAQYSEKGQDIVCAGVSSLALTAFNMLCDHLGEKECIYKDTGYIKILFFKASNVNSKQEVIFNYLKTGLMAIRESYSNYVSVKFENLGGIDYE